VHVCVDDATRLAYAEVLLDGKSAIVIGFLKRAVASYSSHGRAIERLMTDNGGAYCSAVHALACKAMGIRHIRTMLREWAYAAAYGSSPERAAALSGWIERYNFRRRHGALGHRPTIERLAELQGNNVAGIYS
jgi:transposase InsO family protein